MAIINNVVSCSEKRERKEKEYSTAVDHRQRRRRRRLAPRDYRSHNDDDDVVAGGRHLAHHLLPWRFKNFAFFFFFFFHSLILKMNCNQLTFTSINFNVNSLFFFHRIETVWEPLKVVLKANENTHTHTQLMYKHTVAVALLMVGSNTHREKDVCVRKSSRQRAHSKAHSQHREQHLLSLHVHPQVIGSETIPGSSLRTRSQGENCYAQLSFFIIITPLVAVGGGVIIDLSIRSYCQLLYVHNFM